MGGSGGGGGSTFVNNRLGQCPHLRHLAEAATAANSIDI
jgi:hypothetical protein